jgi:hypothetical protein
MFTETSFCRAENPRSHSENGFPQLLVTLRYSNRDVWLLRCGFAITAHQDATPFTDRTRLARLTPAGNIPSIRSQHGLGFMGPTIGLSDVRQKGQWPETATFLLVCSDKVNGPGTESKSAAVLSAALKGRLFNSAGTSLREVPAPLRAPLPFPSAPATDGVTQPELFQQRLAGNTGSGPHKVFSTTLPFETSVGSAYIVLE